MEDIKGHRWVDEDSVGGTAASVEDDQAMSGDRLEKIIFKKDKQTMKMNWGKRKTRL